MITRSNRYEFIVKKRLIINYSKQIDIMSFFIKKNN